VGTHQTRGGGGGGGGKSIRTKSGKHLQTRAQREREEEDQKDFSGRASTRHDADFKNEDLHRKKWSGVLDEEVIFFPFFGKSVMVPTSKMEV